MKNKESYVAICHKHWTGFVKRGIVAFIILIFSLAFLTNAELRTDGIIGIIIALILILIVFIRYKTSYIALTETSIVRKEGFIRSATQTAPITKVQNITIGNGLFGKIFHYGTIIVDNAGTGGSEFKFSNAANAQAFVDEVHKRMV